MRVRFAVVVVVTAAILALANSGASPSGDGAAAPTLVSSVSSLSTGKIAILPQFKYHWWGTEVLFNKWQTKMVADGTAAVVGGPAGVAVAMFVDPAKSAVDRGYCFRMWQLWGYGFNPGIWRCS